MVKDEEELLDRIKQDPDVMTGKPVVEGTRLTVQYIIRLLADGNSIQDIIEEYDDLSEKDVRACLLFASKSLDDKQDLHLEGGKEVEIKEEEDKIVIETKKPKEKKIKSKKEWDKSTFLDTGEAGQTYDDLLEQLIKEHNRLKLVERAKEIREKEEEDLVEVDLDESLEQSSADESLEQSSADEWEETGEIRDYLESKVDEGLFKSKSEVIRAAIRHMIQKDIQNKLKEKGLTPEELKKLREKGAGEILEEKFPELSSIKVAEKMDEIAEEDHGEEDLTEALLEQRKEEDV